MSDLISRAADLYRHGASRREIAKTLCISHGKVRKLLLTSGMIETRESQLLSEGLSPSEIEARLVKSKSAVSANLPYLKCVYGSDEPSENACRIRECRARKISERK